MEGPEDVAGAVDQIDMLGFGHAPPSATPL
jgi:hypothetical protein